MSPISDDTRLLNAWHENRDAEALRLLCERYVGLIQATCRRYGSPDSGEAVQAVFLVLARRAGSVSGSSLAGWLTTTAQRVVARQHRAAAARRRHELEAAMENARQHAADHAEPSWEEARQHLDAALTSLSAGRREAIIRFYLAGRPQSEVAAELGCSVAAVKMRVHEGLEGLRVFFARRGIAFGGAALASGLASEAATSEPALVATCVQTVLTPAAVPGAAALAHGIIFNMIIKTSILVAAGLIVVCSGLTAALAAGGESAPATMGQTAAATTPRPPVAGAPDSVSASDHAASAVNSRGWRNSDAVMDLARSGVCVYSLGGWRNKGWATPAELRGKSMPVREFVETWTSERGQRVVWLREGGAAILDIGNATNQISELRVALASRDATTRRLAAERAASIPALDSLRLAISAAADEDQTVARAARDSIGALGWGAALELDQKAWIWVEAELLGVEPIRVEAAEVALAGRRFPDKVVPMLQKALDKRMGTPGAGDIITALGLVPGDAAMHALESVLQNGDDHERELAIQAMVVSNPDRGLSVLLQEYTASINAPKERNPNARRLAISCLGMAGGLGNEKARAFLRQTLRQADGMDLKLAAAAALCAAGDNDGLAFVKGTLKESNTLPGNIASDLYRSLASHGDQEAFRLLRGALQARYSDVMSRQAGMALGRHGGSQALAILREALVSEDAMIAVSAACGLEFIGGSPGLELAAIALAHPDATVRRTGVFSLSRMNLEKAMPLLTRAVRDHDSQVRKVAITVVSRIGGEQAHALLLEGMKDPDEAVRRAAEDDAGRVQQVERRTDF